MTIDTESTQMGDSLDDEALASALESEGSEAAPATKVAEAAAETPEVGDQEGAQQAAAEYLDEFASKHELDAEQLLGLKVKLKIDGEEKDATLRDIIKINQLEGHVTRKSQELSEARKAFEETSRQTINQWQERVGVASTFLDQQEAAIRQQFQSIDWNALYQQDPGQYAGLQARFNEAAMTLQNQKAQLAQHYQMTQQQQRDAMKPAAVEAIRKANPDLADEASYSNALADMRSYLKAIGAPEKNNEVLELDPVVFQAVRDAARYRAIVAKKPDVANKVRQAETMQKPSTGSPVGTKQARVAQLQAAAAKGNEDALAELFEIL